MPKQRTKAVNGRRPNYRQGRGLEITGHAIEYLIDSYVAREAANSGHDAQAAQILMGLNMAIYLECAEIIPLSQRLKERLRTYVTRFIAARN